MESTLQSLGFPSPENSRGTEVPSARPEPSETRVRATAYCVRTEIRRGSGSHSGGPGYLFSRLLDCSLRHQEKGRTLVHRFLCDSLSAWVQVWAYVADMIEQFFDICCD
jgi:hypothetical protein